jgi:phage terminase large subunit
MSALSIARKTSPSQPAQFPAKARALFGTQRYTVLHGGRGSAKSQSVARALVLMAAQKPLRVLCCREIQRSIRDSVHRLLADVIEEMNLLDCYRVMETQIQGRNGSLFLYSGLSTQTIDSIKSLEGVDLAWVEEAQTISERSWSLLIPTIRKPGSRFILTMNPQLESDPTSVRFLKNPPPGTVAVQMNWRDNPWFPKELDDERRHHQARFPETYPHVWEGEHLPAVEGAIFFRDVMEMESAGRVRPVPHDPLLPVHTVWDLGHADNTSIICVQVLGSEIRVIDYLEDNNRPLSEYVRELEKLPYRWGDDFIPHDGFHTLMQTGQSVADVLYAVGRKPQRVPQQTVESGIKLAREVFPRVFIDERRGEKLLECLKRYRWAVPVNGTDAKRPLHDAASHGADAFRYLALSASLMRNQSYESIKRSRPRNYKAI